MLDKCPHLSLGNFCFLGRFVCASSPSSLRPHSNPAIFNWIWYNFRTRSRTGSIPWLSACIGTWGRSRSTWTNSTTWVATAASSRRFESPVFGLGRGIFLAKFVVYKKIDPPLISARIFSHWGPNSFKLFLNKVLYLNWPITHDCYKDENWPNRNMSSLFGHL